jgi:tol-pal system beta propeller repeat protein TolB
MESPNKLIATFDKFILGGLGCGIIILCVLIGMFYYLWENPPRPRSVSTPVEASGLPNVLPTSTVLAFASPTLTLAPTLDQKLSPTPTPIPTPTPSFGDNTISGKIVFTCFIKKIDQICLMKADGTGQTQITKLEATTFYASLSPNGETIYFSSRQSGNFEIYSISVSAKNMKRLTKGIGTLFAPELSPNGHQIVFTNDSKQGIWIMNVNGKDPHPITDHNDIDPTWSPDGSMIAFASSRQEMRQLFIMNADGSNIRQVTNLDNMGGRSTWSPDGTKLAFYRGPANDHNIYVINMDGTGLVQLTQGGDNLGPSWSLDGNWITFTSFRDGNNEIYIMHPDGTNQMRLTNNLISDWQPRWGK